MKKYTQEEFNALPQDEFGYRICPTGDYTKIRLFEKCVLGDGCVLGYGCKLGDWCKLGNGCVLGYGCKLGDECELGYGCKLGDWCTLGDDCELGYGCKLGNWCVLGEFIAYGNTDFENGAVKNGSFIKVGPIGSENRDAYFFRDGEGKYFVRAGCWFSDMEAFETRVREAHGGTKHETAYLAACTFARTALG